MSSKVWDEITYLYANFSCATIAVWEWISNFIPYFIIGVSILSMMGFKSIQMSLHVNWQCVSIDSGKNGLRQKIGKPLPEPMMSKIHDGI